LKKKEQKIEKKQKLCVLLKNQTKNYQTKTGKKIQFKAKIEKNQRFPSCVDIWKIEKD
jgi:hypothetical protein